MAAASRARFRNHNFAEPRAIELICCVRRMPRLARAHSVVLPSLAYWRVQRGLSQQQLAGRIGVVLPTVARIEAGHPSFVRTARRVERAIGVVEKSVSPAAIPSSAMTTSTPAKVSVM